MASAQVLRKQEHLEAGKRKLEEFRRKKATEKAKKSAVTSQVQAPTGARHEKQSETDHVQITEFNSVGNSEALAEDCVGATDVSNVANRGSDISLKSNFNISTDSKPSIPASNNDMSSSVQENSHFKNEESKDAAASVGSDGFRSNKNKIWSGKDDDGLSTQASPVMVNSFFPDYHTSIERKHPVSDSSHHGLDTLAPNNAARDLSLHTIGKSSIYTKDVLPQNPASNFWLDKFGSSTLEDNKLTFSPYQDTEDKKFSGTVDHSAGVNHMSRWTSNGRNADYVSDAQSSSNHAPPSPPTAGRRSRPSFLDSIHIPKGSSLSSVSGAAKNDSLNSKVYPMDGLGSSISHRSANSSVASGDGADTFNHVMENKNQFFSQKQNEDFAALEQHIEDLTQEKFSLQRALEASRALAESLASENSTLTDSFNQQGALVNHLKFDLERLQEEIKAHMVELEAVKHEYANAQMECNAADERAKLLASEVIGLEEKALHLRSNELKLERQLENAQTEISSYRKKISSHERDQQNLQSTINALQEEKKLLQSKLRKASSSREFLDYNKTSYSKKDASTSTEDLAIDVNTTSESADSENIRNALSGDGASSSQLSYENTNFSLEGQSMSIPPDQIKMIGSINTLLAELALEKDQLMRALSEESSKNSSLLEWNKELSSKLEAQTQRLELLTAQSLVNNNIQPRQVDAGTMYKNVTYADEGDEVVERVLGWIMKLFPGGPSRRQPSKNV